MYCTIHSLAAGAGILMKQLESKIGHYPEFQELKKQTEESERMRQFLAVNESDFWEQLDEDLKG
jgi:SPX domain protein involved in polyphosphate accumulation